MFGYLWVSYSILVMNDMDIMDCMNSFTTIQNQYITLSSWEQVSYFIVVLLSLRNLKESCNLM